MTHKCSLSSIPKQEHAFVMLKELHLFFQMYPLNHSSLPHWQAHPSLHSVVFICSVNGEEVHAMLIIINYLFCTIDSKECAKFLAGEISKTFKVYLSENSPPTLFGGYNGSQLEDNTRNFILLRKNRT